MSWLDGKPKGQLCFPYTGRGSTILMELVPPILPGLNDHLLEIRFITEVCKSNHYYPTFDREQLITRGICILELVDNPPLQCLFFVEHGLDKAQAMQFYKKALKLSEIYADSNQQCNVLMSIAWVQWITGDYGTAQIHAAEVQRQSKSSGNLYLEARALWIGALCSTTLGNVQQSLYQLCRARAIVGICGLAGGRLDNQIAILQGEIHLRKSEYHRARNIYSQLIETRSPNLNLLSYAISLLNIAHIDSICGDRQDVYDKLNQAKKIFSDFAYPREIIACNMFIADIELRERKFDLAKIKFQECLHSARGTNNRVELFCWERLADIRAWATSEWQPTWPVIYLGYAYRRKDKLALHKALLCLGDMLIVNKDKKTAANLYTVALEGFTHMDVHQG
ncbi:hypothetical protein B0H14DRAFT_2558744 [Mycena olivaceomarginata]|nr:hypothetical protein B0H14DRAFT_2558744 [Mycena olivaceomarginata]